MAILKRVTGEPAGQIIELKSDLIVIGRAPDCHIILGPNGVSRRHAEIRRDGDTFLLADLRSRNKTKVNDVDVTPGRDHRLRPGDRINICDVEMVYYDVPPKPPGSSSGSSSGSDVMIVTDGGSDSHIQTLDASRSSAMAS